MIICPIWACPWAKNLSNLTPLESRLCGTHISEFKSAGTDLLHSKFYGIVWTCSCATSHHGHLPIFPIWACPWAKRLSNQVPLGSLLCGTHISKTDGWIYIVQSFMLLYKPVVVQYMYNGLITFTLYFQGQILKNPYQRNRKADWYGTEGMWIDKK